MPNLYLVAGLLAGVWAFRAGRTFNMLMGCRYSDVLYQLRRPDVLANKVIVLKYFGLPIAFVPICALIFFACSPNDAMKEQATYLRSVFGSPIREASIVLREALDPVSSELSGGSFADFARRSQTVGREIVGQPSPMDISR